MTFQAKTPRVDPSRMANAIRALAMDAVEKANSGHPGLPMGAADIATVLFTQFLKFDARDPKWADRDRFVLSAGHGSMLLYALLYLTGNEAMTIATNVVLFIGKPRFVEVISVGRQAPARGGLSRGACPAGRKEMAKGR